MLRHVLTTTAVLLFTASVAFAQWQAPGTASATTPIQYDGNVGIGTGSTAPPQRFTVKGGHIALDNGQQLIGRTGANTFYFRLIGNDSSNRILLGDDTNSIANEVRFHTNGSSTPTMVITTAGNVGIGNTAAPQKLTVSSGHIAVDNGFQLIGKNAASTFYFRLIGNDSANRILLGDDTGSMPSEIRFHTNASTTPAMVINTSGNVGIGTTTPLQNANGPQSGMEVSSSNLAALWLTGVGGQGAVVRGRNTNAGNAASHADDIFLAVGGLGYDGANYAPANRASIHFVSSQNWTSVNQGTYITFNTTPNDSTARAERMRIDNAGNVGIGVTPTGSYRLDVSGDAHFSGTVTGANIQANYQDLAEWVPASETMMAGTVVVVGENDDNTVTASMRAYDTSVAGVVSANPGLLLGVASASKAKIATTGRVRVRVDATKSPIRKGDLLVTSDRPGMAMKSEPLDFGGVKIHRPGTLIGKALEPLSSGEGEILVLLSLQ